MPGSPPADPEPERFEPDALADLPAELALSRLPGGRHGLPRSFIARNQRARIVSALLRVLPEHGYAGTTIGHVTHEARVSRAAFYNQFSDKEECFLAAYDIAGQWICERVEGKVAAEHEWPARVRAGVGEALRLFAANPALAHLIAVEGVRAGPAVRERQRACLTRFAAALREGRKGRSGLPEGLEDLLLGGALTLIARYADTGRAESLPEAADELAQYLLLPYLGADETGQATGEAA